MLSNVRKEIDSCLPLQRVEIMTVVAKCFEQLITKAQAINCSCILTRIANLFLFVYHDEMTTGN